MRRWLNMRPPFACPRTQACFISRLEPRSKKSGPLSGRWSITARRPTLANHRHNKASSESDEKSPAELLHSARQSGFTRSIRGQAYQESCKPDFYTAKRKKSMDRSRPRLRFYSLPSKTARRDDWGHQVAPGCVEAARNQDSGEGA